MAHLQQRTYLSTLAARYPHWFTGRRVLEVGSLNINGTVRDFFTDCDWTGVDLAPGPGVDVVAEGQALDYPAESFDVAISAECFEHNPYWLETFVNMRRMCSGLVIFTCATTGRPEHGTSRSDPASSPFTTGRWDYYRNLTADDFHDALNLDALFASYEFSVDDSAHDLYFHGLVHEESA